MGDKFRSKKREYKVTYNGTPMGNYTATSGHEAILAALAAHKKDTGPRLEIKYCKYEVVD